MRTAGSGNLVFSPDSIATALAMAGTGAAGRTATQMAHVLHLASSATFAAVGRLQSTIAREQAAPGGGDPQAPMLDLANGLFLQQGYPVQSAFASGLRAHFDASPQTVDFLHDSVGAVQAINAWVSTLTQGIIPHILTSLEPSVRLVLANAIYLKAAWLHPFNPTATASAPFHGEGRVTSAMFMNETDRLPYDHGPAYAAVDLPYSASTLSLLVVLPTGQSMTALQRRLDSGLLTKIVHSLSPTSVALSLPRFHLALQTKLNGILEALGMTDPFDGAANFSRITTREQLEIGLIEHAADFTVDEHGTVAAVTTIVTIEPTLLPDLKHPVRFNANRPFLFFLRDDRTGTVLFSGRLVDPTAAPGG
jgi:serpin B